MTVKASLSGKTPLIGLGACSVSNASLWKIPLFAEIAKARDLVVGPAEPSQSGEMTYRLDHQQITIEEAKLTGNLLSLYGHGIVTYDSKVHLTVQACQPELFKHKLPALDSVGTLFKTVMKETAQFQITGSLAEPWITFVPFQGFTRGAGKFFAARIQDVQKTLNLPLGGQTDPDRDGGQGTPR